MDNIKKSKHAVDDQFYWLKVNSKYESLQKKLRNIIIEKLNDVLIYFFNYIPKIVKLIF